MIITFFFIVLTAYVFNLDQKKEIKKLKIEVKEKDYVISNLRSRISLLKRS